ncbi:hypothetical protein IKD49_00370 [Candidatus Saccharibacteria bacterium]|nr:hypothetical protein [Candidatus Saccharibacteria bacterium]
MFFDNIGEVLNIAKRCSTAVFVVPDSISVDIKNAIILKPEQKSVITVEQIRDVLKTVSNKQIHDQFIIIRPADLMSDVAANAILKNLEEPVEKIHFLLITENVSRLLPTVLSRASIYFLRKNETLDSQLVVDDKIRDLAKRLLSAKPRELSEIVDEITRKKDGVRGYALSVIGVAIEILYKSYFLTSKDIFVNKIPKFLAAYDGVSKNGHVKLQILANLC